MSTSTKWARFSYPGTPTSFWETMGVGPRGGGRGGARGKNKKENGISFYDLARVSGGRKNRRLRISGSKAPSWGTAIKWACTFSKLKGNFGLESGGGGVGRGPGTSAATAFLWHESMATATARRIATERRRSQYESKLFCSPVDSPTRRERVLKKSIAASPHRKQIVVSSLIALGGGRGDARDVGRRDTLARDVEATPMSNQSMSPPPIKESGCVFTASCLRRKKRRMWFLRPYVWIDAVSNARA